MTMQSNHDLNRPDIASPLTKWKKEPSVLDLKADLLVAQPWHDAQVAKVQEWLDLRDVKGSAKPKRVANRSAVQPKLVRKQAEWRYSALTEAFLSAEELFNVGPKTWEDLEGAKQNGQVINHQFMTELDRVAFIDEYVRTTVDEGTCYVKPGWIRETRIEKVEVPVWAYMQDDRPEVIEALNAAIQLSAENPQGWEDLPEDLRAAAEYAMEVGVPVVAVQQGVQEVEEEVILKNRPTLEIINFENVYIDPSCGGNLDKANFAIISFETSKAQLVADGRYKNLDKVNWSSHSPIHEPNHASYSGDTTQFRDDLRRPVVAYEYWGFYDVEGNDTLTPIVATWIGNTLIRMEENPHPDKKIPLVLIPYLPVKNSLTGEPDAELLGDNQAILGAVTRGMIDLMGRSANGQTAFAKGMLDVVNRRRYDRGEDYEFNPQMPPAQGIYTHQYPEIPASALNMLQLQNQEAESLTGVKAFSGGLSGSAYGDVAAGIRGMLDAAAKREMSILRRLASGMEKIGRKIVAMNQAFLSEEETVQITNGQFVKVNRKDIQGEYNLVVKLATAEIEEAQAQDLGFMLQTLGNTVPFEITQEILVEIATLKRMPRLAHKLQNFQPQPDPLAEKLKELEIAKLDAEIAELRAKAMLAEAKARSEASEADLKDLNFLEQETGTKHARDMQKQQAQAESNQMLQITKGVLSSPDKRPSNKSLVSALNLHQAAAASANL
jgi:hypothetical protein